MSTSRHLTGLRRFAKAAVAVCASLGLVLAAGGCGASSGESKTIYFWNNLVGDDGPAMQRIVKEYNAQSDYKVVFQPMNGGDLTTKIYSVMQTGKNIPDIIIGDQFQTAVLQSQGLLDTMDDWQKVAPDLKESSFLPATWKGVTVNGKAYGIPLYLYQMAIYYNKDLVKKYNLQYIRRRRIRHHRRDQGPQGQAIQGHLRADLRQSAVGLHVPAVRRGRHA